MAGQQCYTSSRQWDADESRRPVSEDTLARRNNLGQCAYCATKLSQRGWWRFPVFCHYFVPEQIENARSREHRPRSTTPQCRSAVPMKPQGQV